MRDAIIKVCEKTANYTSTVKSVDEELSHINLSKQKKMTVSKVELERIVRNLFPMHMEMEDIRLRDGNDKLKN